RRAPARRRGTSRPGARARLQRSRAPRARTTRTTSARRRARRAGPPPAPLRRRVSRRPCRGAPRAAPPARAARPCVDRSRTPRRGRRRESPRTSAANVVLAWCSEAPAPSDAAEEVVEPVAAHAVVGAEVDLARGAHAPQELEPEPVQIEVAEVGVLRAEL